MSLHKRPGQPSQTCEYNLPWIFIHPRRVSNRIIISHLMSHLGNLDYHSNPFHHPPSIYIRKNNMPPPLSPNKQITIMTPGSFLLIGGLLNRGSCKDGNLGRALEPQSCRGKLYIAFQHLSTYQIRIYQH